MQTIACHSVQELSEVITAAGPDALFRGQVSHYTRTDGTPSLTTSFTRLGCVPDLMIKWYQYARQSLRHHVQGWKGESDYATDQAILQHYGWRSFFLDATGDPRVGAWFASHQYTSDRHVELVEDCFEDPVWLITDAASYTEAEGPGHLYLISRKNLRSTGIGAVHLSEIATRDGAPRYVRQDAYMVGPLGPQGLRDDALLMHITAPANVFASYANGLGTTHLFPEPEDDPIFKELLAMPWERVDLHERGVAYFRRSLSVPEYQRHITKHMPETAAMYRPFWLVDLADPTDPATISYVLCSSGIYYGTSELSPALPRISELVNRNDGLIVDPNSLVYHGMGTIYGKGIQVMKKAPDLVLVCEIGVDHPGRLIRDIRRFPGLHYRIDNEGIWTRFPHPEDCNCGTDDHERHMRLLGRIEVALDEDFIALREPRLYVERGLDRRSDTTLMAEIAKAEPM